MRPRHTFAVTMLLTACGGEPASVGPDAEPREDVGPEDAGPPGAAAVITLRFERVRDTDFDAIATVVDATGQPVPGLAVLFSTARGNLAAPEGSEEPDGRYRVGVVPEDNGGEHRITASVDSLTVAATAVVFGSVGERWGQPVAVEGLVNTEGWEDGIFVTRDMSYLFVQYVPVAVNCKWTGLMDPAHCEPVRGPITGPERPGFTGAARIDAGTVTNTCFEIPPASMPFYIPPCDYYGFRRQPDGSYAEPVRLSFEGAAGCLCPVGLNVYPNSDGTTAAALFSYNDPTTFGASEDGTFFVTADIPLGTDVVMGTWSGNLGTGSLSDPIFASLPIPTSDASMLGVNPFGVLDASDETVQIWFDNEANPSRTGIWMTSRDAGGDWSLPTVEPAPVTVPGIDERMPFYANDRLTIRRDNTIATIERSGGEWASDFEVDLDPGPAAPLTTGEIVVVGEPTIAIDSETGRERLFFNYGVYRADGTTNLNVGSVLARP